MSDIALDELAGRLGDVALVAVRNVAEFAGAGGTPRDPRQGHIPGAHHLDLYELMAMSTSDVHDELGLEPGSEIVAYCHGGSRSAIAAQVLRSLGYDARNYVGSWHEWSRHDDLPIER